MSQASYMPKFYGAQAFVNFETISAAAQGAPRRVKTPVTSWECPFIYLFGGYGSNGLPLNSVWEGVLSGLTFKPVF